MEKTIDDIEVVVYSSGPWVIEDEGEFYQVGNGMNKIAQVEAWDLSGEDAIREAKANAVLIKKAPDMHNALQNILPMFRKLYQEFDPDGEIAVWGEWFQMGIDALPDFDNMDEEIGAGYGQE